MCWSSANLDLKNGQTVLLKHTLCCKRWTETVMCRHKLSVAVVTQAGSNTSCSLDHGHTSMIYMLKGSHSTYVLVTTLKIQVYDPVPYCQQRANWHWCSLSKTGEEKKHTKKLLNSQFKCYTFLFYMNAALSSLMLLRRTQLPGNILDWFAAHVMCLMSWHSMFRLVGKGYWAFYLKG